MLPQSTFPYNHISLLSPFKLHKSDHNHSFLLFLFKLPAQCTRLLRLRRRPHPIYNITRYYLYIVVVVHEKDMGYTSLHRLSEEGRKWLTLKVLFCNTEWLVPTDLNKNDDRKQISHLFSSFFCRGCTNYLLTLVHVYSISCMVNNYTAEYLVESSSISLNSTFTSISLTLCWR